MTRLRITRRVAGILLAITFLNWFAFMGVAQFLGGDALRGKVEDGHYFLGMGGAYVEVTYPVYLYSALHTIASLFGLGLGAVSGVIYALAREHEQVLAREEEYSKTDRVLRNKDA